MVTRAGALNRSFTVSCGDKRVKTAKSFLLHQAKNFFVATKKTLL